jgi:hypothetical protein
VEDSIRLPSITCRPFACLEIRVGVGVGVDEQSLGELALA